MQYWSMAVDYPFNVGGRPYNSWPVFIPVTFELLILVASFSAFLGMLFLNGLPRPNHPVFNVPRFARASQDRFFSVSNRPIRGSKRRQPPLFSPRPSPPAGSWRSHLNGGRRRMRKSRQNGSSSRCDVEIHNGKHTKHEKGSNSLIVAA